MEDSTNVVIEVDRRGWHHAFIDHFEVYGNRYLGPAGKIFWNTSLASEEGTTDYWVDEEDLHYVSTCFSLSSSSPNQIVVHELAKGTSVEERNAIFSAIVSWEKNLSEHNHKMQTQ